MTDLSPAEQAVADVLVDGDWSQVTDVVVRGGVAATARELVAAARPLIAAEVLREAADRWPMAWPIQGHDWLRERARRVEEEGSDV